MCRRRGEEHIPWQVGVNVAYSIVNHYLCPPFAIVDPSNRLHTYKPYTLTHTFDVHLYNPLTRSCPSFSLVVLSRHQRLLCGSTASP